MKKYDFFALHCAVDGKKHPPFLQDFCKKCAVEGKKLRERGSSTARPTEKGVGGLTIRSRFGRDLRTSSWRFVLIRSSRSCRVAIRRVGSVDSVARPVDFGASRRVGVLLVSRFGRVASRRSRGANTKKKPDSSIGESGSAIARRRALLTFR